MEREVPMNEPSDRLESSLEGVQNKWLAWLGDWCYRTNMQNDQIINKMLNVI